MKFLSPVSVITLSCLLLACGSSDDPPDASSSSQGSRRGDADEARRQQQRAIAEETMRAEEEARGPTPQQLSEISMLERRVASEKRAGGSDYAGFQQELLVIDQQRRYLIKSVKDLSQEIAEIENRERAWRAGVAPEGDLGKVFIHKTDSSFTTERLESAVLHVRNSSPHAIGHVWIHAETYSLQIENHLTFVDFEFTPPQLLPTGQTASWPISLNALVSGLYGKIKMNDRRSFGRISKSGRGFRAWITSYDNGSGQPLPGVQIPVHDHKRLDTIRKNLPSQQDRLDSYERDYQRLLKDPRARLGNQKSELERELDEKKRDYGIADDNHQSAAQSTSTPTRVSTARRNAPERSTPTSSPRPHAAPTLPTASRGWESDGSSIATPTPTPRNARTTPRKPSDETLQRWKEELQRAEGTYLYRRAQELLIEARRLRDHRDYNGAIEAAKEAWNRKRNTLTPDNPELTQIEDMIEQTRAAAYERWKEGKAERDFNNAHPAGWAIDVESFRAAVTARLRGIENADEARKALADLVGREVNWTLTGLRYVPDVGARLSFHEQTTRVPGPAHTTEQLTRVRIGLTIVPGIGGVDRFVDISRISPNSPEYKRRHRIAARISEFTLKKSVRADWTVFPGWTTQVLLEDSRLID